MKNIYLWRARTGKGKRKRILFIDDEENFLELVKLNLKDIDKYEVRIESGSKRALATAREFKPDLILLDIDMPEIDGGEVAALIEADKNLKNIPVVFLTALVQKEEEFPRSDMIGRHKFIAKPIDKKQLIDCIEENIIN